MTLEEALTVALRRKNDMVRSFTPEAEAFEKARRYADDQIIRKHPAYLTIQSVLSPLLGENPIHYGTILVEFGREIERTLQRAGKTPVQRETKNTEENTT
jgi:hypothetical protein